MFFSTTTSFRLLRRLATAGRFGFPELPPPVAQKMKVSARFIKVICHDEYQKYRSAHLIKPIGLEVLLSMSAAVQAQVQVKDTLDIDVSS